MDRTLVYSSTAIIALVGLGFYLSVKREPTHAEPTQESVGTGHADTLAAAPLPDGPRAAVTATDKPNPSAAPSAQPEADDETQMAELRKSRGQSALITLRLAREGSRRFPKSKDAAERAWFEVKALTDLGQFDAARDAAQRMVQQFPNTDFATDVYRHVLQHPPGPPPHSPNALPH